MLHAQQLLTIIYYSGPRLLVDHLQSPVCAIIISYVLDIYFSLLISLYNNLLIVAHLRPPTDQIADILTKPLSKL